MANTFHLSVRTPEAEILDKEVLSVKVMTEGGEIEIHPHHASLTGAIMFGKMKIRTEQDENEYIVQRGVVLVSVGDNSASIMCYSCKEMKDIEYKSAKEYLDYVEEQLKSGADLNDFQLQYLENEKIAMVQQLEMIGKE